MTDLSRFAGMVGPAQGLVVVSTSRADGTVQASLVNAGVLKHPVTGEDVVGFVALGGARKLQHMRERPEIAITIRDGWAWACAEGPAQIIGPDDPHDGVDLPRLLRDVFTAAGGTHDDWDTYDKVMAQERRAAVLVRPRRTYPA